MWKIGLVATILAAGAWAQVTQLASVSSSGQQGNDRSDFGAISANGRFIAFDSSASNLVPGGRNGAHDVFVHDRLTGTTERVSVTSSGQTTFGGSGFATISADGRFVAFISDSNLVPNDNNIDEDVFLRDRQAGTTIRVSVGSLGEEANSSSAYPSISGDGRYVAFESGASNLVAADTNGSSDVFVHDCLTGETARVSISSNGTQGDRDSFSAAISGNGRFVAFQSRALNLDGQPVTGDEIYVHDRTTGSTTRASVDSQGHGSGGSAQPTISFDGRFVAWNTTMPMVPFDTNGTNDIYVHDRDSGITSLISVGVGAPSNGANNLPRLSATGRFVVFHSEATNLVPGDANAARDVFLRDRLTNTTERISVSSSGTEGNANSAAGSVSADGRYVAFSSLASNIVQDDTNPLVDVFIRDRQTDDFQSLCSPDSDGVRPCPCASSPADLDRGCDNSSTTGGASLSATGMASVSADSLVFTTSGERPTALSVVMQGNGVISNGVMYGQGVRCVGGTIIRRLFVKHAVGGSIIAPDFEAPDPSVSVRSAAKGDPMLGGESRWYLVYYRDPVVLGGCPASSTFNATQTGRIDWSL